MIDFEYLITSEKIHSFLDTGTMEERSINEHRFSEIIFLINEKYGDDIECQESL